MEINGMSRWLKKENDGMRKVFSRKVEGNVKK